MQNLRQGGLSVIVAYAAIALIGAIVLGVV